MAAGGANDVVVDQLGDGNVLLAPPAICESGVESGGVGGPVPSAGYELFGRE